MRQRFLFEIPECKKAVVQLAAADEEMIIKKLSGGVPRVLHVLVMHSGDIRVTPMRTIRIYFVDTAGNVCALDFMEKSKAIKRLWEVLRVAKDAGMID